MNIGPSFLAALYCVINGLVSWTISIRADGVLPVPESYGSIWHWITLKFCSYGVSSHPIRTCEWVMQHQPSLFNYPSHLLMQKTLTQCFIKQFRTQGKMCSHLHQRYSSSFTLVNAFAVCHLRLALASPQLVTGTSWLLVKMPYHSHHWLPISWAGILNPALPGAYSLCLFGILVGWLLIEIESQSIVLADFGLTV